MIINNKISHHEIYDYMKRQNTRQSQLYDEIKHKAITIQCDTVILSYNRRRRAPLKGSKKAMLYKQHSLYLYLEVNEINYAIYIYKQNKPKHVD